VLISDTLLVNEAFIQTDIFPILTLSFVLKAHRPCMIFQHGETIKPRGSAIRLVILVTSWFGCEMENAALCYNKALSRVQECINSKTVNMKIDTPITNSKEGS